MKSVIREKYFRKKLDFDPFRDYNVLRKPRYGAKERSIRIEKEVDWSPQGGRVHSADVF